MASLAEKTPTTENGRLTGAVLYGYMQLWVSLSRKPGRLAPTRRTRGCDPQFLLEIRMKAILTARPRIQRAAAESRKSPCRRAETRNV